MNRYSSSLLAQNENHLADVLKTHGNRWEVGQEPDTGVWFAIERPTPTALHIVVDHTLAGLAAKLNAAGTAS